MTESTAARVAEEEDWDIEGILDEAEISDDVPDGQPDPDEPPSDEEPADEEGEAPAEPQSDVESEPEGGPPADDAGSEPEASTAPDSTPPSENTARPFSFRVDGESVAPEGAFIVPAEDGEEMVVMPLKTFQQRMMPQYIGSRQTWQRQIKAKDLELQELRESRSSEEAQVKVLLDRLNGLLDDPDEFAEFMRNFETQAPVLKAQAETARAKAEADEIRNGRMTPEERLLQEERLEETKTQGLGAYLQALAEAEYPDVPAESLREIFQRLNAPEMRQVVFHTAPEDDPEGGFKKGDPVVYLPTLRAVLEREQVAAERRRQDTATVAQTVRQNTVRVNGGSRKTIPPAGRADGSPPPAPPQKQEPKTREEWLRSLEDED